jgi:hypothetical protein
MKRDTILRAFRRAYDGKDVFDPEPAFWRAVKHVIDSLEKKRPIARKRK